MNDYVGARRDDEAHVEARSAQRNVSFVEVEVEGARAVFQMALRDIAPGEVLLCDYGDGYWRGHEHRAAAIVEIVALKDRLCLQVAHILESDNPWALEERPGLPAIASSTLLRMIAERRAVKSGQLPEWRLGEARPAKPIVKRAAKRSETISWAQCELCSKWRMLPAGAPGAGRLGAVAVF